MRGLRLDFSSPRDRVIRRDSEGGKVGHQCSGEPRELGIQVGGCRAKKGGAASGDWIKQFGEAIFRLERSSACHLHPDGPSRGLAAYIAAAVAGTGTAAAVKKGGSQAPQNPPKE